VYCRAGNVTFQHAASRIPYTRNASEPRSTEFDMRVESRCCEHAPTVRRSDMNPLSELLKLRAHDRAEIAMALWESLSDTERESALELTQEQRAELDRRWAEHLRDPGSAVPWSEVRRKLLG
jgi:putative addiction module component (TIGR02574 family)